MTTTASSGHLIATHLFSTEQSSQNTNFMVLLLCLNSSKSYSAYKGLLGQPASTHLDHLNSTPLPHPMERQPNEPALSFLHAMLLQAPGSAHTAPSATVCMPLLPPPLENTDLLQIQMFLKPGFPLTSLTIGLSRIILTSGNRQTF